MSDLPSPHDELAIRLLERWVSVVRADTARSFLHGPKRKVTTEQVARTIRALESIKDDHALREFVSLTAPRWQAQLIVTAMVDFVGSLGDLPPDDPLRADLNRQLEDETPLVRIAETVLGRPRS